MNSISMKLLQNSSEKYVWKEFGTRGIVPIPRHCHSICYFETGSSIKTKLSPKVNLPIQSNNLNPNNNNFSHKTKSSNLSASSSTQNILGQQPVVPQLILYGGYTNENCLKSVYLSDVHFFDIHAKRWEAAPFKSTDPRPEGRHSHTALIENNNMWVFGGIGDSGRFDELWRYDLLAGSWHLIPKSSPWPSSRWAHSAVIYKGSMIIFGGFGDRLYNDLWQFNFQTQQWGKLNPPNPPGPRQYAGLVAHEESKTIFVTGGFDGRANYSDLFVLDDLSKWTLLIKTEPLLHRRSSTCVLQEKSKLKTHAMKPPTSGATEKNEDLPILEIWLFAGRGKEKALNNVVLVEIELNYKQPSASKPLEVVEIDSGERLVMATDHQAPAPRHFHASAKTPSSFFVVGGFSQSRNCNDIHEFSLEDETQPAQRSLQHDLRAMLKHAKFTDITFLVEDKEFNVHKDILCFRGDHFKALITNRMKESAEETIRLHQLRAKIFAYTDSVQNVEGDDVIELLEAADRFLLFGLKNCLEDFLIENLSNENFESFQEIADKYSLPRLLQAVCSISKSKN